MYPAWPRGEKKDERGDLPPLPRTPPPPKSPRRTDASSLNPPRYRQGPSRPIHPMDHAEYGNRNGILHHDNKTNSFAQARQAEERFPRAATGSRPHHAMYEPFPFASYAAGEGAVTTTSSSEATGAFGLTTAVGVARMLIDEVVAELAHSAVSGAVREEARAHLGGATERDLANTVMVEVLLESLAEIATEGIEETTAELAAALITAEVVEELALGVVSDALVESGRIDPRDEFAMDLLTSGLDDALTPSPSTTTQGHPLTAPLSSTRGNRKNNNGNPGRLLHRKHRRPGERGAARLLDMTLFDLFAQRLGTSCNAAVMLRGAHRVITDPVLTSLFLSRGVAIDTSMRMAKDNPIMDAARRAAVRRSAVPMLAEQLRIATGEHLATLSRRELIHDAYDHLDFRASKTG